MKTIEINENKWIIATGYRKNILASSDDLGAENTLVQLVIIESGNVVKPHYHNITREFYYITMGTAEFTINDIAYKSTVGDMMITEPGDIHSVKNDSSSDFKILVFKTNASKDDTIWLDNA
jgi:quercetin dioxygenase-like cupin family protein